jgi:hypothetical protein
VAHAPAEPLDDGLDPGRGPGHLLGQALLRLFPIGRTHYGAINGALTVPITVAKALAPFLAAALWSALGDPSLMLWTILGCALLGTVGFVLALSGTSH